MTARIVKYALPVLALVLFAVAVAHVMSNSREAPPASAPRITPAVSPFAQAVAGSGIVEPRTENITIGAPLPGIVQEVFVQVGQKVKAGDKLFRLDDRELKAKLRIQEAAVDAALADLERLEHLPRPEDVPVLEAQVRQAEALAADKQQQVYRLRKVAAGGGGRVTDDELQTAEFAAQAAAAEFERVTAQLDLLKAGSWEYEKKVAQAAVARTRAEVANVQTDLERLIVTAPIDSEILQTNVRPGQYVGAASDQGLLILGNTEQLHIRVDIDENDIPRYHLGAPAAASLRGDPEHQFPLTFVRVEPFVVPKRSLTGDNSERVDTRVLQLIYRVASDTAPQLYVGQQVDVFIDGAKAE